MRKLEAVPRKGYMKEGGSQNQCVECELGAPFREEFAERKRVKRSGVLQNSLSLGEISEESAPQYTSSGSGPQFFPL